MKQINSYERGRRSIGSGSAGPKRPNPKSGREQYPCGGKTK